MAIARPLSEAVRTYNYKIIDVWNTYVQGDCCLSIREQTGSSFSLIEELLVSPCRGVAGGGGGGEGVFFRSYYILLVFIYYFLPYKYSTALITV